MSQPSAPYPSKRTKSALVHLRVLPAVEPTTSTGRVAWIWCEIEAALATGKKLREIWDAAYADGLDIPYPQFRVYVSRIRRRRLARQSTTPDVEPTAAYDPSSDSSPESPMPNDPFRNLRDQREKKQSTGFHYDPFSVQKQLID